MSNNRDEGQEWRKGGHGGQHDEEGIIVVIDHGMTIRTPSIYEVARKLGKSHHDTEVWQEYEAIPDRIVADHRDAAQLRARVEALEEALRQVLASENDTYRASDDRWTVVRQNARALLSPAATEGGKG